jgi:hypothetical protein
MNNKPIKLRGFDPEPTTKPAIKPCNIFHTPEDMDELEQYLANFSGGEAIAARVSAMMAWNLACKLTAPEVTK